MNGNSTEEMKVSAVLADQLKAGGIDVEVEPMVDPVLQTTILQGDYDIKLHSFYPGYIYDKLELFHSKYYVPLGEQAPWFERNSFRYKNPAFDAVVDEMAKTPPTEVDKMKDLFHQAMAIWFEDLPVIPGVQAPALVPINSTCWTGAPSADNPWIMPVCLWATFNLVVTGYPSPTTGGLFNQQLPFPGIRFAEVCAPLDHQPADGNHPRQLGSRLTPGSRRWLAG